MTPNKVIEHVDGVKPNVYSEEDKFRWLCDLDGMISKVVMQQEEPVVHVYPDDMDSELLVGAPFEGIYALYLEAQIDFHNQEYGNYNDTITMFNSRFDEYKKAYIRDHMPKDHGTYKNI